MKFTFRSFVLLSILALVVSSSLCADAKSSRRRPVRRAPQKAVITPASLRGKVLFARASSLWIVDPVTRREQLLMNNPFGKESRIAYSTQVAVSPDFKSIVLEHRPSGDFTGSELWLVSLNSKLVKRLTNTGAMLYSTAPRFSPDGKQIVYTRRSGDRMGGPGYTSIEIRMMNADGTNDRSVIGKIGDVSQSYFGAFWNRDGKRLMFTHYIGNIDYGDGGNNKRELQTCAIDGTDTQPFDGNYGAFLRPDVSPDGSSKVVALPVGKGVSLRVSNTHDVRT